MADKSEQELATDLQKVDEFTAKKEALKKRQQSPEYFNPKCTQDELKDIFGG